MKHISTRDLVQTALLAALVFLFTFVIRIPIPNGYVHLGDGAVMLCGFLLGPVLGPVAAIVGSVTADYLGGFTVYMLPTAIAKGLLSYLCARAFSGKYNRKIQSALIGAGALASVAVYYFAEIIIFGNAVTPLIDVPFNLLQTAVGIAGAALLLKPLKAMSH